MPSQRALGNPKRLRTRSRLAASWSAAGSGAPRRFGWWAGERAWGCCDMAMGWGNQLRPKPEFDPSPGRGATSLAKACVGRPRRDPAPDDDERSFGSTKSGDLRPGGLARNRDRTALAIGLAAAPECPGEVWRRCVVGADGVSRLGLRVAAEFDDPRGVARRGIRLVGRVSAALSRPVDRRDSRDSPRTTGPGLDVQQPRSAGLRDRHWTRGLRGVGSCGEGPSARSGPSPWIGNTPRPEKRPDRRVNPSAISALLWRYVRSRPPVNLPR